VKSYLDVPEDEAAKSYEFLVSHMPDNMIVRDPEVIELVKKLSGPGPMPPR